jgi:3-oxoacyl-[acyl-carrier-protein] synthase-3
LGRGTLCEPGAVLATDWGSDGAGRDLITIAAGGSRLPDPWQRSRGERFFRMQGRQVYAHAVRRMTESSRRVLSDTGWRAADVDAFIGHQANQRILDAVADRLDVPPGRRLGNIAEVGNTAAASIPLALAEAVARKAAHPGARTLLTAFGGGLTWASTALTWPDCAVRSEPPRP